MWQIHILIENNKTGEKEYKPMCQAGKPYEYKTKLEAGLMARTCYPDHLHLVKIVPVWEKVTNENGYTFWSLRIDDEHIVYNVTTDEKTPPQNESGYYSLPFLLRVKGVEYSYSNRG